MIYLFELAITVRYDKNKFSSNPLALILLTLFKADTSFSLFDIDAMA